MLLIKGFIHNFWFDWFVIDRDCDMNILLDFTDFVCNIDFVSCIKFVLCGWYNRYVICILGFNSIICEIWNLQSTVINDAQRVEIMVSLFLLVDSAPSSSPTTLVTLTHCPRSLLPPLQSNLPNGFLLPVKTEVASHNLLNTYQ